MGGHVIFSHFDYFDQLLDAAVVLIFWCIGTSLTEFKLQGTGEANWATHERVSYVWYNLICIYLKIEIHF